MNSPREEATGIRSCMKRKGVPGYITTVRGAMEGCAEITRVRSVWMRSASSTWESKVFFVAKQNAATNTNNRSTIFMVLFWTNGAGTKVNLTKVNLKKLSLLIYFHLQVKYAAQ